MSRSVMSYRMKYSAADERSERTDFGFVVCLGAARQAALRYLAWLPDRLSQEARCSVRARVVVVVQGRVALSQGGDFRTAKSGGLVASETRVRSGPVRSVVASLQPDRPAACPFAADSSEPDRPLAVKADAVAPPLRGFGLDGLMPPRFGLSKQTKADWGLTALPTRTAMPTPTMCLATAATTPAPWTARLWKVACGPGCASA